MRLGSFLLVFACVGCGAAPSERPATPVVEVAPATTAAVTTNDTDETSEPDAETQPAPERPSPSDGEAGMGRRETDESDETRAKRTFKEGIRAFETGDFATARRHFEEAYRILPGDTLFFKLAETTLAQGDHNAACAYYKQWIASPSAQMKPRTIPVLQSCP